MRESGSRATTIVIAVTTDLTLELSDGACGLGFEIDQSWYNNCN